MVRADWRWAPGPAPEGGGDACCRRHPHACSCPLLQAGDRGDPGLTATILETPTWIISLIFLFFLVVSGGFELVRRRGGASHGLLM